MLKKQTELKLDHQDVLSARELIFTFVIAIVAVVLAYITAILLLLPVKGL
jgi:ABC-type phosphate/phosphonate transport system permease subunit